MSKTHDKIKAEINKLRAEADLLELKIKPSPKNHATAIAKLMAGYKKLIQEKKKVDHKKYTVDLSATLIISSTDDEYIGLSNIEFKAKNKKDKLSTSLADDLSDMLYTGCSGNFLNNIPEFEKINKLQMKLEDEKAVLMDKMSNDEKVTLHKKIEAVIDEI